MASTAASGSSVSACDRRGGELVGSAHCSTAVGQAGVPEAAAARPECRCGRRGPADVSRCCASVTALINAAGQRRSTSPSRLPASSMAVSTACWACRTARSAASNSAAGLLDVPFELLRPRPRRRRAGWPVPRCVPGGPCRTSRPVRLAACCSLAGRFDLVAGAGQLLVAHRRGAPRRIRARRPPGRNVRQQRRSGRRGGVRGMDRAAAAVASRRSVPPTAATARSKSLRALSSSPLIARTAAAARSMVRIASSSGAAGGSAVRAASISASRRAESVDGGTGPGCRLFGRTRSARPARPVGPPAGGPWRCCRCTRPAACGGRRAGCPGGTGRWSRSSAPQPVLVLPRP